jgi:hypothetical protein
MILFFTLCLVGVARGYSIRLGFILYLIFISVMAKHRTTIAIRCAPLLLRKMRCSASQNVANARQFWLIKPPHRFTFCFGKLATLELRQLRIAISLGVIF